MQPTNEQTNRSFYFSCQAYVISNPNNVLTESARVFLD